MVEREANYAAMPIMEAGAGQDVGGGVMDEVGEIGKLLANNHALPILVGIISLTLIVIIVML